MLFTSCALLAQEKRVTFGVKGGLNYGDNGKIEITDVTRTTADDRVGYHLGVFLRGKLTDNIYLKTRITIHSQQQYLQTCKCRARLHDQEIRFTHSFRNFCFGTNTCLWRPSITVYC